MPSCSRSSRPACLSSRRITTRSPCPDGKVDTRTSTARPATRNEIRPSCGRRFSAISSFAITLIRDITNGAIFPGGCKISRNIPSTRKRIRKRFSNGSTCTSEALTFIASLNNALIKRMIGASSSASIRSSGSSVSASSSKFSSSPTPSIIAIAWSLPCS